MTPAWANAITRSWHSSSVPNTPTSAGEPTTSKRASPWDLASASARVRPIETGTSRAIPRVSGSRSARSQQARSWAVVVSRSATLVADRTASSPTRAAMSIAARCGVATDSRTPSGSRSRIRPSATSAGTAISSRRVTTEARRKVAAASPSVLGSEDIMSPTRSRVVLAATASSASPWGDATSSVSGTRSGTHNASMPASSHMRATSPSRATWSRLSRITPRRASRARGARVGWKVFTRLHLFAMRTSVRWIDASIMVRR